MRTICLCLFAASVALVGPAAASPISGSEPIFAQATSADQASSKKKAKRKRAPKVEYMRAVPSR